jgi:thiol-disulfide isomerase/thioredoxin
MKKLHLGLLALLLSPLAGKAQVTIAGQWHHKSDGNVRLFRVEHGRLEEIATAKPGVDSAFGFYFQPAYEGFYVIGTGSAFTPTDKHKFYLKTKDQLQLNVNDSSYTLTGKNSPENVAMEKWHNIVRPLERKGVYFMGTRSDYTDFFPQMEATYAQIGKIKFAPTGNAKFDKEFAMFRDIDFFLYASELLNTPRSKHPKKEDYTAYLTSFDVKQFTGDTRLLRYPYGVRVLRSMQAMDARLGRTEMNYNDLNAMMAGIVNDTLKGEVVIAKDASLKTYIGHTDLEKEFGKYVLSADQKARLKAQGIALAKQSSGKGKPAINFTYPDLQGKQVSLTDFKGKVVLVDVWATWCGPCKQEIPSLKKMEEEMHDKNVVFMSVSVDVEKDHQKWKDFVASEKLSGVQLFASGWSDIAKFYDIKGIPRFMVFDKQGNIVSTDAPRPSSKELRLLLEEELKK